MLFTSSDSIYQFPYISLTSNSPHSSHLAMASQYGQHRSWRSLHASDGSPVNNGKSQIDLPLPATSLCHSPTFCLHHSSTSPAANTLFTAIPCLCQPQHSVCSNTLPLPAPTFCLQKYPAIVSRQHFVYITTALRQPQHSVCSNTRPLSDANLLFAAIPGHCQTPTFCLHHCPTFP